MGFVNTGGLFKNLTIDAEISNTSENAVQNKAVALALEGKARSVDLTSHINNTIAHISTEERTAWNAKQNALSTGNVTTAGITKLYSSTGTNTDGAITQNALTTVLGNKANKSITVKKVITVADWVGYELFNEVPTYYGAYCSVYPNTINENTEIEVVLNTATLTSDQIKSIMAIIISAKIYNIIAEPNYTIRLRAYGVKPTMDIPLEILIRG